MPRNGYYYRKSLLNLGMLPTDQLCPFLAICPDTSCPFRSSYPTTDGIRCDRAKEYNHQHRSTPEPNPTTRDGRGRTWEKFSDASYYDMTCIRCVDGPDPESFNASMSFHFQQHSDASAFWDALPRTM